MIEGLEVSEPSRDGYIRNVEFESWVTATMTYSKKHDEKNNNYIERHMETDEVFILADGEATLVIGMDMERIPMEKCKVYNVKKGVWHTIYIKEKSTVIIVENSNTSPDNTEYYYFR